MAKLLIHQSLKTQRGERVLIYADPTYFPELTEQVRIEVLKAEAVELCVHTFFPPGVEAVRTALRRREDPALRAMEDEAIAALFGLADIFIWMPSTYSWVPWQTERIIQKWKGRGIHFHMPFETHDPVLFRRLAELYEQALYIDYNALALRNDQLERALQNTSVLVTDPAGTRLSFEIGTGRFHRGNGNASKEWIESRAVAGSARDREVELPAGGVRTVDVRKVEGRIVSPDETLFGRRVGALRIEFAAGRITRIETEYHNAYVVAMWNLQSGDKDRFGEFVVGTNPHLTVLPDYPRQVPYHGFGAGYVRLALGANWESGGPYESSFQHLVYLSAATVTANSRTIVDSGRLV